MKEQKAWKENAAKEGNLIIPLLARLSWVLRQV